MAAAADHWAGNAAGWENAATEVSQSMRNPGGSPWQGAAADSAQLRAYNDRLRVISIADQLHAAAGHARSGTTEIAAAKRQALSSIQAARTAGFTVGEDLSVSYVQGVGSGITAEIRRSQALEFATQIRTAVSALVTTDQEVARKIASAATGVSALTFPEAPPNEPKPDDPKDPGAKGLSVRNAEDVHKRVDPLPPGRQPHVKVLPNSTAVRALFDELTGNSVPAPPSSYPGESRVLEDGTRISYREGSKSGGSTIDIVYPDGTQAKVHVEEVPKPPNPAPVPVPAPAPAPVVVPTPQPLPASPGPVVEAPPVKPEDVGVIAVIGGIGIAILAGIGKFGKVLASP